jgi:hypothetical protein
MFKRPDSSAAPTASTNKVPAKKYVCQIIDVESSKSKAGNPMLVFHFDIAQGPYKGFFSKHPKRLYVTTGNPIGDKICNRTIETIIKDNPGMIPANALNAEEFDEKLLIGLQAGVEFEIDKQNPQYIKVKWVISVSEVPKDNTSSAVVFAPSGEDLPF